MGKLGDTLNQQLGNAIPNIAGDIVNTGMGLLLEGHEDRRQIRQQQKLTNMQLDASKNMTDFNYGKQMDMWNNTNYEAQMAHLKNAGLNPALLYGQGGGGGTTTGSGSGAQMSMGQGVHAGGEAMGLMMKSNLAQTAAQTNALNSQAELNKAQATKIAGVDTEQTTASIDQIKASTSNTEAQTALTNVQTAIAEIEKGVQGDIADKGYRQRLIEAQADKINREVIQIANSNWTFNETKEAVIQTIKQNAINSVIESEVKIAGINLNNAQINKLSQDIIQRGKEIDIKQFEAEIKANYPQIGAVTGSMLNSIKAMIDKLNSFPQSYTKPNQIPNK